MPRVGLLFAHDFDREGTQNQPGLLFDRAGFDLFSFPSQLGLAWFNLDRFVRAQVERGRRLRWHGVFSAQEQYGALAAALVARELGLPGTDPRAIVAAQHKAYARRVLQQVAPEANLDFDVLQAEPDQPLTSQDLSGLRYPLYLKPVKAAFSILAKRIDTPEQLRAHLAFSRWEKYLLRRLIDPFESARTRLLPEAGSAYRMLIETPVPLSVPQYNLDGFMQEGQAHAIGVVDALMYPGTQAFMRWDLPSRLPQQVQQRALSIASRFLQAIGFSHGLFNLEFFHDPITDRITIIECNPRMASQFSDLYRRVLGLDLHALALHLALGQPWTSLRRQAISARVASSLVYRSFPGEATPRAPNARQLSELRQEIPDALVFSMPKDATGQARDYKWTGSHRYGLVHLGASDWGALNALALRASRLLGWPDRVALGSSANTDCAT
ncbi:MAG: ATP-grasp domain-containing protein [Burkholderiaceae bacterium]